MSAAMNSSSETKVSDFPRKPMNSQSLLKSAVKVSGSENLSCLAAMKSSSETKVSDFLSETDEFPKFAQVCGQSERKQATLASGRNEFIFRN